MSEGRYREFEAPDPRVELFPSGINDEGYLTGEYIRPDRESGFIRDGRGKISTIDVPRAKGTEAVKINDRRQIVGRYSEDTPFVDDSARVRGYIRHRGTTTRIDAPRAVHTLPTAINDRGDVALAHVALVDDRAGLVSDAREKARQHVDGLRRGRDADARRRAHRGVHAR